MVLVCVLLQNMLLKRTAAFSLLRILCNSSVLGVDAEFLDKYDEFAIEELVGVI